MSEKVKYPMILHLLVQSVEVVHFFMRETGRPSRLRPKTDEPIVSAFSAA